MKRSKSCWLSAGWLVPLLCLLFLPTVVQGEEAVGKVIALEGVVWIIPAGSDEGRKASPGTPVYEGDTIQSEKASRVKLLMVDESILNIAEETRLSLDEYRLDTKGKSRFSLLSLVTGKVRLLVARLFAYRSRYRIQTPTAVMGVRGTSPVIWTDPDPDCSQDTFPQECGCIPFTWLLTLEGELDLKNVLPDVSGEVTVQGGWISLVCEERPPTEPRLATDEEIQKALEGTYVRLIAGKTFMIKEAGVTPEEVARTKKEVEGEILGKPPLRIPPEEPGEPRPDETQEAVSTEPLIPPAGVPPTAPPSEELPKPPPPPQD